VAAGRGDDPAALENLAGADTEEAALMHIHVSLIRIDAEETADER
jgi:hypothetical protein